MNSLCRQRGAAQQLLRLRFDAGRLNENSVLPAWNQIEITKRLTGRRVGADGSREERKKPPLAYTSSRSAGQPVSRRLLGLTQLPPLHLLAQASSLCAPLQPPGKTAAQAPPPRGSQPRAPHRVAAAARPCQRPPPSRRSHISRTRCRRAAHRRARVPRVPPASAAATAPQAKPWPPRRSAGARAHLLLMTLMN